MCFGAETHFCRVPSLACLQEPVLVEDEEAGEERKGGGWQREMGVAKGLQ